MREGRKELLAGRKSQFSRYATLGPYYRPMGRSGGLQVWAWVGLWLAVGGIWHCVKVGLGLGGYMAGWGWYLALCGLYFFLNWNKQT
jgi:hypothetical protein